MARTAIINFHDGMHTESFYDHENGDVWSLGDEIRQFCDVDGHGRKVEDFAEFTHDLVQHLENGGWLFPETARQSAHADLRYNISLAKNGQVLVYLVTEDGKTVYQGRAKDAPWFLNSSNPER